MRKKYILLNKARKPEWQDTRPPEEELRNAYAIAEEHEEKFARNFTLAAGALIGAKELTAIRAANTTEEVMDVIPLIGSRRELERINAAWDPMRRRYEQIYASVIDQSGLSEFGIKDFDEVFTATNSLSQKWIKDRSSNLIREISDSTRESVRDLVEQGFLKGKHPRQLAREIEQRVGLTLREGKAVENFKQRRLAAIDKEKPAAALRRRKIEATDKATDKYAKQLRRKRALRISRTETLAAQSAGRDHSWKLMQEAGFIEPTVQREWVAVVASGRTCEICLGLDGDKVGINESFNSEIIGSVNRPPAHPQCLTPESVVLVDSDKIIACSRREYVGDILTIKTKSGNAISCTPNHPILTPCGWVLAHELKQNHHIISSSVAGYANLFGNRISSIFDNFNGNLEVDVSSNDDDFHGDGTNGKRLVVKGRGISDLDPGSTDIYKKIYGAEVDCIVSIDSASYDGDVYNVETETGRYIAGGIFNHNCRCTVVLTEE